MAKSNKSKLTLMIAEAAYYRAENRNFAPGFELQDWLEAEQAVTAQLKSTKRLIATKCYIRAPASLTTQKKSVQSAEATKSSAKLAIQSGVTSNRH